MRTCVWRSFATRAMGEDATALTNGRAKALEESSTAMQRGASAVIVSSTAIYGTVSRPAERGVLGGSGASCSRPRPAATRGADHALATKIDEYVLTSMPVIIANGRS